MFFSKHVPGMNMLTYVFMNMLYFLKDVFSQPSIPPSPWAAGSGHLRWWL